MIDCTEEEPASSSIGLALLIPDHLSFSVDKAI